MILRLTNSCKMIKQSKLSNCLIYKSLKFIKISYNFIISLYISRHPLTPIPPTLSTSIPCCRRRLRRIPSPSRYDPPHYFHTPTLSTSITRRRLHPIPSPSRYNPLTRITPHIVNVDHSSSIVVSAPYHHHRVTTR